MALAFTMAMAENFAFWPLGRLIDRYHPARRELEPLQGNRRALAAATWRHALFGVLLGALERAAERPTPYHLLSPEHPRPTGRPPHMSNRTFVIGVGMTKFEKPGSREWDYPDMAREAGTKALEDAGIPYDRVEQAFVGYCYGESTSGQRAVYGLGLTGIPVVNVNNNCSTGSSALYMARQAVRGGLADCALALGFEKMEKGSLGVKYTDRTNPIDKHLMTMFEVREPEQSPFAPQMFGNAGREHMERYGSEPDHYAWIGWKNHKHSVNNPYAQFQDEYSLEDIKAAKMIHEPLTKLQCSPTSDGSALRDRRERAAGGRARPVGPRGRDRRPGDGHRHAVDVRGAQLDQDRRLRHVEEGGRPGLRGGGRRSGGRRRDRAARLLLGQRADHLRGARAWPRRARATSSSTTRTRPTAGAGS